MATSSEYRVEVVQTLRDEGHTGHNEAELQLRLNARAMEGWRLYQVNEHSRGWLVVYERTRREEYDFR